MAQAIQQEVVLFGHYADKTMVINGHLFHNGACAMLVQPENLGFLINYFQKYNGHFKGTPGYDEAVKAKERADGIRAATQPPAEPGIAEAVHSETGQAGSGTAEAEDVRSVGDAHAPGGEASVRSEGDGREDTGVPVAPEATDSREPAVPVNLLLRKAVMALDSAVGTHWTAAGLPAMAAVEEALGDTGFTRADVSAAAPEWDREKAAALKEL
jgi:hypothetical protein